MPAKADVDQSLDKKMNKSISPNSKSKVNYFVIVFLFSKNKFRFTINRLRITKSIKFKVMKISKKHQHGPL